MSPIASLTAVLCLASLASPLTAVSEEEECRELFKELQERYVGLDGDGPEDIAERVVLLQEFANAPCDPTVRFLSGLFDGGEGDAITMEATLVLGRIGTDKSVQAIVQTAAPALKQNVYAVESVAKALEMPLSPKAEKWLLDRGLASKDLRAQPEVWRRIVLAAGKFHSEEKAPKLLRLLSSSRDAATQANILDALRHVPDKKCVTMANKLCRSRDVVVQTAALSLLYEQGGKKNRKTFIKALKSPNWQARLLGLKTLFRLADKDLLQHAKKALTDFEPRVQISAIQILTSIGTPEVVEPLIARVDVSDGRVKDDLIDALIRLTGEDLGIAGFQWEAWWKTNRDKMKTLKRLSHEEISAMRQEEADKPTSVYHGFRILSDRFAFIFDASESMQEKYVPLKIREASKKGRKGGGTKVAETPEEKKKREAAEKKSVFKTKLEVVQRELLKAVSALKDGTKCDIIRFESVITDFVIDVLGKPEPQLVPIDDKVREAAEKFVMSSKAQGQTYMLKALETAFADPTIDTIYLLSDGAPTPVETAGPEVILRRVRDLNRLRNVKINTIGIDLKEQETTFLQKLAAENFGVFVAR